MAYRIALFLHVCAALAIFMAVALEVVGILGLRSARTVEQVRVYSNIIKPTEPLFPAASVTLIVAGLFLALTEWSLSTPFVAVGLVALVVIAGQGAIVQGRRWRAVGEAAAEAPDGPVPDGLRSLILHPPAWASTGAGVMSAVGAVAIMTIKPGWVACVTIVAVLWLLGFVGGRMLVARPSPARAPRLAG